MAHGTWLMVKMVLRNFNLRETHERALLMQPTIDEAFEEKLDESKKQNSNW